MILKIEKISSVGIFRDYKAKGDVSFNLFTLIYAENGSGKTTIASIIRSLKTNDESIIRKRLSTHNKLEQTVQLFINDDTGTKVSISFGKSGWKTSIKDFEIFDTHFVNENIFSGFEISDQHKKRLHQFVIGAQGVALKNKILKNKEDKESKRLELNNISKQIVLTVKNGLTEEEVKNFIKIKLPQAKDIENKIKTAKTNLENAQGQKTILKYSELPTLNKWPEFDFNNIINDIEETTKTIQDDALEKAYSKHIDHLSKKSMDDPEDWLRIGFDYVLHKTEHAKNKSINEVNCPFCKQNLSANLDIINAYSQIFNKDFNEYLERLQKNITHVATINIEALITSKNANKKIFDERLLFWKQYVTKGKPIFKVVTDSKNVKEKYKNFKKAIKVKAKNPSRVGNIGAIREFESIYNEINQNIESLNISISQFNKSIKEFKFTLKDIATAEKELNSLQRIKKRFEKQQNDLCIKYVTVFKDNKQLEDDYKKLVEAEEKDANKFISTYAYKINYYLKDVFDTPFSIDNMLHGSRKGKSKEAKVEYQLLLDGKPISFDTSQPFSVSDCLSEGDKSTIAFSFFLSKLEIDSKLSNKILVFDDPLSSLDRNRREITAQLIIALSKKIKQTIVLSHNENFIWELYENYDKSNRKVLRINQNYKTDTSFIEPLNIEYLVENKYFVSLKEMDKWLSNPDPKQKEKVLGLIRNVLESHLRFKFYRQLNNSATETFGKMINKLETPGIVIFRDDPNRETIISDLRLLNGISWKPHHGEAKPNYGKLGHDPSTISDKALALLVKKTFKLIDNDL